MASVVEVRGLEEVLARLRPTLWRKPLKRFLTRSAIAIENAYRDRVTEDTGRARASITHEVHDDWARVGSNVEYLANLESGTGLLAEGQPAKGGRHWPPASALDRWARRHGFPEEGGGYLVARAIGRRGGLKPRWWLRDAVRFTMGEIRNFAMRMAREIESEWRRG